MRSTRRRYKRLPFGYNPKAAGRISRLRKLQRKGLIKPMTKAEARKMCDEAVIFHKGMSEVRAGLEGVEHATKPLISE